ncbi:MAG: fold metallo-hydrolase [Actinomycetota bacterium]|jgi:ribonuclease Z|nr:fold metallo-hydrolase [Actinomycetota bacterium]
MPSLRSRIALALIKKKLPEIVAADPLAELGDGLHIAIVGSGSPLPDAKRGNPCTLVIAGDKVIVVDAGEGASETINRMGIDAGLIDCLLLTHFHSDHIGGLGSVNLQRWVAEGSDSPMRVLGPPGVEKVIAGYNEAYELDRGYRVEHHKPDVDPAIGAMVAVEFPVPAAGESDVVLEEDGLVVTAFEVDHSPVGPVVGFRFDYKGRSAVISADTVYSENLVRASKNTDLLVHDALSEELLMMVSQAQTDAGNKARGKILADVLDYHATAPQAADAAQKAGAKALAITHIVPPLPLKGLEDVFLADAPDRFDGPLWLASDGDLYSLPPAGGLKRSNLIGRGR